MVFKDIVADCESLSSLLENLNEFINILENYKDKFVVNRSKIILDLSKGSDASYRGNKFFLDNIYDLAQEITIFSLKIVKTTTKFSYSHFYSNILSKQSNTFLSHIEEFVNMCNTSNLCKNTSEKYTYANRLYTKFEELYEYYVTLYSNISFFKSIKTELYNEIPEQIQNNPDYMELNIQSNKETSDLVTMSKDIELISNIIVNIQALLPEDVSKDYYIQKVESGSILVSLLVSAPLFKQVIATIDYCATIYYKHRNNHLDLKMKENELEQQQILTKFLEKALDIEITGENLEQAEKVINMTMRYLTTNPSGKLNDKKYDLQNQTSLLTNTILQNTADSNEPETPTDE